MPFMFEYKKRRDEFFHSIGIDVFSSDWYHIAEKATGRKCLALDYSRFDATHPRGLIIQSFQFIASHYEQDGDREMIVNLGQCLANFCYYFRGRVYMATGGQPSGSQVTTVLNSIINSVLWLQTWKNLGERLEAFCEHCDLVTFGDDCILFADRYAQTRLTPSLVIGEMAKLGYTLTAPDKSDTLEYTHLARTQYLGRTFATGPGNVWIPRREEGLVWSSLCWEHEEATPSDVEGRIRAALSEFAMHDNWAQLVQQLDEFCRSDPVWHGAWCRVPTHQVVMDFRRRVGLGGRVCDVGAPAFGQKAPGFENAIPKGWEGIPPLSFG